MNKSARLLLLLATASAVALTAASWWRAPAKAPDEEADVQRAVRKARLEIWNTPLTVGRCAIAVAHFGGARARLVRAEKDGTVHYAIVESTKRNGPIDPRLPGDWVRGRFGAAETVTLATYPSAAAAMARAAHLCPPRLRCLPGRPGCAGETVLPNPMEIFGTSAVMSGEISTGQSPPGWAAAVQQ